MTAAPIPFTRIPSARIWCLAGLSTLAVGGLATDYTGERTLRVSHETKVSVETTDFSIERDGEPMEGRFGGRLGGGSEGTTTVVHLDTVLAHEDGLPTKVKRVFDQVDGTISFSSGDQSREMDRESPMEGKTLILTRDDEGDTLAALEDDEDPEDSAMLEGHSLTLSLDALLPADDVEAGDSWEPEGADLLRAIGLNVERALFPRPERPEGGGGEGRRGGRGGFRGGPGSGSPTAFFRGAEWDTKATLTGDSEDVDGVECVVIELRFEAEGDLPERRFGRDRREHGFGPGASAVRVESTFEVELEGKLYFSTEQRRPVRLVLEGEFTLESENEFERQGSVISMSRTQEGRYEHRVTIQEEE